MFHRFSDDTSFFVATMNQRPIGLETPFSIQLADRTPVLRGTCVVLAAWTTPDNPFKRPGVRLGIRRLTPESEPVFAKLRDARAQAGEDTAETAMEPLSETPVVLPLPPGQRAPTGSFPRVPTGTGSITMSRTATGSQRRLGSVMTPALIPPKTPPEANVLEVILPIVADSPSEATALPVEVEPPVETRTPGSDFILPANPLMNLSDDSLKGFVDCTLYEDTANFPNEPELPQVIPAIPLLDGDEQVLVARTENNQLLVARTGTTIPPPIGGRRTGTTIPPVLRLDQNVLREEPSVSVPIPVMRTRTGNTVPPVPGYAATHAPGYAATPAIILEPSGLLRVEHPTGQSEPLRIETQSGMSGQLRLESSGLLRVEQESGQSGLLRVDGASGMLRVDPLPPPYPTHSQPIPTAPPPMPTGQLAPLVHGHKFFQDVHTPVPAGEAFLASEATRRRPAWLTRRTMIVGGAAAASLLAILIIVVASSSSNADRDRSAVAPPPPAPAPAPVTRPVPVTRPAPVAVTKAEPQDKDSEVDPAADGPVVVGDGPCRLEVTTSPAGTMIALDGRPIGAAPLTVAGSCDRHKVDIAHPRYKAEHRFVSLAEGKPTTLDVTLIRPTHNLKILTSPPGAEVFIGGRRAGTSPTLVQINGFSGIEVRIERAGFKKVSKRFYSKTADDKLYFSLDPLPRKR